MSNENFKESQQGQGASPGKYRDTVNDKPLEQRTMVPSLPSAPDPSPFKLGGGGNGGSK